MAVLPNSSPLRRYVVLKSQQMAYSSSPCTPIPVSVLMSSCCHAFAISRSCCFCSVVGYVVAKIIVPSSQATNGNGQRKVSNCKYVVRHVVAVVVAVRHPVSSFAVGIVNPPMPGHQSSDACCVNSASVRLALFQQRSARPSSIVHEKTNERRDTSTLD